MRVTRIETFVLHVPVTGGIADRRHQVRSWGAPGVRLHTDAGIVGTGYTGTHAHLPTDRMIVACIDEANGPLLLGADPRVGATSCKRVISRAGMVLRRQSRRRIFRCTPSIVQSEKPVAPKEQPSHTPSRKMRQA